MVAFVVQHESIGDRSTDTISGQMRTIQRMVFYFHSKVSLLSLGSSGFVRLQAPVHGDLPLRPSRWHCFDLRLQAVAASSARSSRSAASELPTGRRLRRAATSALLFTLGGRALGNAARNQNREAGQFATGFSGVLYNN